MAGDNPFKLSRLFLGLAFGYVSVIDPAIADSTSEAKQSQTHLIPQNDIVIKDNGSTKTAPVTYNLNIYREENRIKLKGSMSSEENYKTLIGLVKANFPATDLSDRVKISENTQESEVKIGGLSFALKLLSHVETGRAKVDNNGVYLSGTAGTAVVLTEINDLIEKTKPSGVVVDIRIARPDRNWQVTVNPENKTVSVSGEIHNFELKEKILSVIQQRFFAYNIEDKAVVNADANTDWAEASIKSLEMLSVLDKGSVEIADKTIHLKGDISDSKKLGAIDKMSDQLPKGFALKSEVAIPVLPKAGIASVPAPKKLQQ